MKNKQDPKAGGCVRGDRGDRQYRGDKGYTRNRGDTGDRAGRAY